jgi:Flp pilus assembly protein TadG
MALVLPLFLLVVLGALTLAQFIYHRKSVVMATAEGARLAAQRSSTAADVRGYVQQILAARRITGGTVSLSPATIDSLNPGDVITVTTTAPFAGIGQTYFTPSGSTSVTYSASILRE